MTYQRVLSRLCTLPALRIPGRRLLNSRLWTVERGPGAGLKLRFPQNHEYISGTSEIPVQREIVRRLQRGGVFYDIGANIGFFSLIAGRLVGDQGHVVAFEPQPKNAATIIENTQANGLHNVRVVDVAVGNDTRLDQLVLTEWDGGAALSQYPTGRSTELSRTQVQVVSLDQFIPARGLLLPTFVKIDVEGAEMEVIEGMKQTIAECAPILLYEIDDEVQTSFRRRWDQLDDLVRSLGYEVTRLDASYPTLNWQVGHSVATPTRDVLAA